MKGNNLTQRSQAGFTLVELAIVMIIIGLLIAGVLKGQELIANAQVTSTVAQAKAMDAATSTFRDTYNALPGDIVNPGTRLPNCTIAPCTTASATAGNGRLDNLPGANPVGAEGGAYFVHLNSANLLSGIVPGTDTFGGNFPAAKINGNGFQVGSVQAEATPLAAEIGANAVPASSGVYLALTNTIGDQAAGTTTGLRPSQALRIDTKLDDSVPDTGDTRAFGDGTCGTATSGTTSGTYSTANSGSTCGLYIRIQN